MRPNLLLIRNRSQNSLVQFNLSTHLLDFLVLIFRPRVNTRDLFFQLGDRCFEIVALLCENGLQLLHLLAFFQELIEQHRIDLFVADCFGLSLSVPSHQSGTHLRHLLGDQAKG